MYFDVTVVAVVAVFGQRHARFDYAAEFFGNLVGLAMRPTNFAGT